MGHMQEWWRWVRSMPRGLLILLCSGLILGALLVGFAAGRLFPAGLNSMLISPTMTQAGARMIGDTATLGGTERGFTAEYGAPIISNQTMATYNIVQTNGAQSGLTVEFEKTRDGTSHVSGINLSIQFTSGIIWDESMAEGMIASLLPTDAVHMSDVQQNDFTERIFLSGDLAATFPAALFTADNNQKMLPAGMFDAYCEPSPAGDSGFPGGGICTVALGAIGGVAFPCPTAISQATTTCSTPTSTPRPRPTSTPRPRPTSTPRPRPTSTPTPTATPTPTTTPAPFGTP